MLQRICLMMLLAFTLSGCVTIPTSLQGEYAQEPLPNAVTADNMEQPVRWGGVLLDTRPDDEGTCMLLVARQLDDRYRPRSGEEWAGQFIACHDVMLDPNVFLPGRNVTVVGLLDGFAEGYVGEEVHLFPMVRTRSAHAWPAVSSQPGELRPGPGQAGQSGTVPRVNRFVDGYRDR
jgi:outer membrane lipoprotein